ncbi:hypothetical protein RFI_37970, partial [Reticulomyxa filosa]
KMGRGHFHLIKCNHPGESCNIVHTQNNEPLYLRRHANPEECGGRNDLDKVTHEYYWENCLKFEDPCQPLLQKQFERCNHYCPHPDHEKTKDECGEVKRSYCAERLWHDPVTEQKSNAANTTVMDGHVFTCSHRSSDYHVLRIFFFWPIPFTKKKGIYVHKYLSTGFLPLMSVGEWPELILNATYDAIHSFIQQRWQTGCRDKGTIIFYESTVKTITENIVLSLDTVRTILLPAHVPWGGTSFVNAIRCVYDVVKRNASKPIVLIFLTDGADSDNGASELLAEIKAFCSNGFHFFPCILSTGKSPTLNKMASTLGVIVKSDLDANGLETHFVGIAKKLTNISFTQD